MLRSRRWIAGVAVGMALAAAPLAALAGGWSTVTADAMPAGPVSGQEFTIGFTVLQHGQTPLSGLRPMLKLTPPGSGEPRVVPAVDEGRAGHYVARVVLDQPGDWQWVVEAFEGDHVMAPLAVRPAAVAPASTSPATVVAGSVAPAELLPLAVALLGMLSVMAVILVSRSRWRARSRGASH